MATINMLEETANYLLNHCFVLGGVEDQRAKYLYVQDHLDEVRAVFAPLGYSVLLYPAPLQAAALVNGHEGSQARLLKYESILLLVLRLLYLQKRESLAANADEVLVTVEEVQTELQKMNLPRRLDQKTLENRIRKVGIRQGQQHGGKHFNAAVQPGCRPCGCSGRICPHPHRAWPL